MEICTQVNVIPLNTNLECYNIIDIITLIMSKNSKAGIINSVPLTKLSQNARKKNLYKSIS